MNKLIILDEEYRVSAGTKFERGIVRQRLSDSFTFLVERRSADGLHIQ